VRDLGDRLVPLAVDVRRRAGRDRGIRTVRRRQPLETRTRPASRRRDAGQTHRLTTGGRLTVIVDVHLRPEDLDAKLREDARRGLTSDPKYLLPTWLYDARGSELVDEITRPPEYYPTRTEFALRRQAARALARPARPHV